MAQHTGGAKMDKVEKKIEKKAPHGVTHHGHSGGAKMSEVEKKIEKSKEPMQRRSGHPDLHHNAARSEI